MRKIISFFTGTVTFEVKGAYPERFLNLCARNGIKFRNMEMRDIDIFVIDMSPSEFLKIAPIVRKSMCRIHIVSKSGLPFMTKKVKKRTFLMAGCALFCLVAWVFTGFVWSIEVDGFDGLDEKKLMEALYDEGLRVGMRTNSLNLEDVRNNILIEMPELSYVYINFSGAKARVLTKPRKEAPEILPQNTPCDIIADKDGIIHSITVKTGTPHVLKGDVVTKGQLLAGGYMTGRAGTTVITHADADILAKTYVRLSCRIPKKQSEKVYTGREKKCRTIILFGKRIKLYPNSRISYTKCDKIIKRNDLTLSERISFPLSLETATYREYEISQTEIRDEDAYALMGQELSEKLSERKDCEVINTEMKTSSDESFAYVELLAECVEKIGIERKILKE